MYPDHEFDPITPEEEAQRAQEAEFARRVRREVLRIERGEAEEEIRADLECSFALGSVQREKSATPPLFQKLFQYSDEAFSASANVTAGVLDSSGVN